MRFSVAVRSDFYGWTDEYHYDGSLSFTNADKVYFDTLTNDFDSYIDSVEEMGRLFNYIYLFGRLLCITMSAEASA
jgi:hypothetical protein